MLECDTFESCDLAALQTDKKNSLERVQTGYYKEHKLTCKFISELIKQYD